MPLLLALTLMPLVLAIVLARGEPVRTISCLAAMGVACLIACSTLLGLVRDRI